MTGVHILHLAVINKRREKWPGALPNRLLVGQHCEETWSDVIVVAHVLVLLLAPDHLSAGVFLCLRSDQVEWERRDLRRAGEEYAEWETTRDVITHLKTTVCIDREGLYAPVQDGWWQRLSPVFAFSSLSPVHSRLCQCRRSPSSLGPGLSPEGLHLEPTSWI